VATGYAQKRAISARLRSPLSGALVAVARRMLAVGSLAAAGCMLGSAGQAHADTASAPVQAVQCDAGQGVELSAGTGGGGGQSVQRSPSTVSGAIPTPPAHIGARRTECPVDGLRSVSRAPEPARVA
jgi:hypothetical protein